MNPQFDPFSDAACWVIDEAHVKVHRLPGGAGGNEKARFRKTFITGPQQDYSGYNRREHDFLLLFMHKRLKRVARTAVLQVQPDGLVHSVETYDAGPSLWHWLRLPLRSKGGSNTMPHPLGTPQALLRLLSLALRALRELHEAQVVHADVKESNLCLPFVRHPQNPDWVRPDWEGLCVIDFAFSLSPAVPLRQPLPIRPEPAYHSPAFQAALEADHQHGEPARVSRLDWRIDLYALGCMAARMRQHLRADWPNDTAHQRLDDLALAVITELQQQDTDRTTPSRGLHNRLAGQLDQALKAGPRWDEGWYALPAIASVPSSAKAAAGAATAWARPTPLQPGAASGPAPPAMPRPTPLRTDDESASSAAPGIASSAGAAPTPLHVPRDPGLPRHTGPAAVLVGRPLGGKPVGPVALPASPAPARVQAPMPSGTPQALRRAASVAFRLPPEPAAWLVRQWRALRDASTLSIHRQAAARGEPEACFRVGSVLMRGLATAPDPLGAWSWLKAAAEKGHAAAQAACGTLCEHGTVTTPDLQAAADWYRRAADQGHAYAQFRLGVLYSQGRGLPRDDHRAIQWFRLAAAAQLPEGYLGLAQMLWHGRGAPASGADALECLRRAADAGLAEAAFQMAQWLERPPPELAHRQAEALSWYRRAQRMGHGPADVALQRLGASPQR